PQPPTDAPRHPAAAGECVSPGLGDAVGRLAAPGAITSRALCPRTLASCPNGGRRGSRAAAGPAQSRMRRWGTGLWHRGTKLMHNESLMKNVPVKGWPRGAPRPSPDTPADAAYG